ncbi:MAG: hypothetical protein AAGA92_10870 [Planctomycetota bacterium]
MTLDGEPLKFGTVMLQDKSGGQPARGSIGPDGSFVCTTFREGDGAMLGQSRVSVRCYSGQDPSVQAKLEPGQEQTLGQLLIPQKYTMFRSSGIVVDVGVEGNENLSIELVSERRRR